MAVQGRKPMVAHDLLRAIKAAEDDLDESASMQVFVRRAGTGELYCPVSVRATKDGILITTEPS